MELSAFLVALKACLTEREVDRLSARAIRLGLPDVAVIAAAAVRINAMLDFDEDGGCAPVGWNNHKLTSLYVPPESVSQFDY